MRIEDFIYEKDPLLAYLESLPAIFYPKFIRDDWIKLYQKNRKVNVRDPDEDSESDKFNMIWSNVNVKWDVAQCTVFYTDIEGNECEADTEAALKYMETYDSWWVIMKLPIWNFGLKKRK